MAPASGGRPGVASRRTGRCRRAARSSSPSAVWHRTAVCRRPRDRFRRPPDPRHRRREIAFITGTPNRARISRTRAGDSLPCNCSRSSGTFVSVWPIIASSASTSRPVRMARPLRRPGKRLPPRRPSPPAVSGDRRRARYSGAPPASAASRAGMVLMPQIFASTAMSADLRRNAPRRRGRVVRPRNRPADDQYVCSVADRLGRSRHTLLVVGPRPNSAGPRGSPAGSRRRSPAAAPQPSCGDATTPSSPHSLRQRREPAHLIGGRTGLPDAFQIVVGEAGQAPSRRRGWAASRRVGPPPPAPSRPPRRIISGPPDACTVSR